MKYLQINEQSLGQQDYNLVEKVNENINVYALNPYPSEGVFLLDENANVLDKNADSYPAGTIKAYGFKAGDGNYYAVDAENTLPDRQYWGGYDKLIESIPSISSLDYDGARRYYNGEQDTTEIIAQLKDYNDGYTTGAPAAEACRARTFNHKQGFLPSIGQLVDFHSHRSEVDSLATKFSLDPFPTVYYHWSSTVAQNDSKRSWYLFWGDNTIFVQFRSKLGWIRAFFAL